MVIGNVVLQIDRRYLSQIIQNQFAGLGESGEVLAGTQRQQALILTTPPRHAPDKLDQEVTLAHFQPLLNALAGEHGSGEHQDYRGQETLAAWRYLPSLNWGLMVKIDTAEINAPIDHFRRIMGRILIGSIFLAVLGIWLTNRRVGRPLKRLADTVAGLQEHALPTSIQSSGPSEIQTLVAAFNRLIQSVRVYQTDLETKVADRAVELRHNMDRLIETNDQLKITRYALDHSINPIFCAKEDGSIAYANEAAGKVVGYSREELLQTRIWELDNDLDAAGWKTHWQTMQAERYLKLQRRHRRKNGETFPVELEISFLTYGEQEYIFAYAEDITERQRIETIIHDSENRAHRQREAFSRLFREEALISGKLPEALHRITETLAETIGIDRASIWLLSDDATELHCVDLYVANTHQHELQPPLSVCQMTEYMQTMRTTGRVRSEDALTEPHMREFQDTYLKPNAIRSYLDGAIQLDATLIGIVSLEQCGESRIWHADEEAFIITIAAIVAQLVSYQTRRETEEKYQMLIEKSRTVVFEIDLQGRILHISSSALSLYGYTPDELVGSFIYDLHPPDAREECRKRILAEQLNGLEIPPFENPMQTKSGDVVWVLTSALIPIYTADGVLKSYRGIDVDITDLKQTQEELRQATAHAQEMAEQADTANRAKSEFLANMSHEIRTPMNAIIGFADILSQDIVDPRQREQAQLIAQSGQLLLRLINDILDLSKIEAGKLDVYPEPCSLHEITHSIWPLLQPRAREKGIGLQLSLSPDMPEQVLLDGNRLRQILLNLISNAIKFTEKGHVDVLITASDIATSPDTATLTCSVTDTGVGIPDSFKQRIFGAFEQAAGQDHSRYGGTGLGLTISQRLAYLMNGEISVADNPEETGSVFTLKLKNVHRLTASRPPTTQTIQPLPGAPPDTPPPPLPQPANRQEFLMAAEECLQPQLTSLRATLRVKQANETAETLKQLATAFAIPDLARIGDALNEAANSFQIPTMQRILAQLTEYLDTVRRQP
jgi:PAS domain S-box-containing protein